MSLESCFLLKPKASLQRVLSFITRQKERFNPIRSYSLCGPSVSNESLRGKRTLSIKKKAEKISSFENDVEFFLRMEGVVGEI
jgi:hypothetical protein